MKPKEKKKKKKKQEESEDHPVHEKYTEMEPVKEYTES